MHIWVSEKWVKKINWANEDYRSGLRIKIDKNVDPEVKRACKEFAVWLRKEYFFPIRVPIYVKASLNLKTLDGSKAFGTFFRPDSFKDEPYIRIAAGDYGDMLNKWGKDSALAVILKTISHELTHYFQWINGLELTLLGEERQATKYSRYILNEYAETRDHP